MPADKKLYPLPMTVQLGELCPLCSHCFWISFVDFLTQTGILHTVLSSGECRLALGANLVSFFVFPPPPPPPPSLPQPPSAVYKLSTFLCFCRSHLGYSGHLWYKLWIYETSNLLLPAYNAWHCHCLLRVLVSDVLNVKVNFIDTKLSALISFPIAFFLRHTQRG